MANDTQFQDKVPIGLIQISLSKNTTENLEKAIAWIEKTARQGARIICLPELFRSQYFCQLEDTASFDLAEPVPGPTTESLSAVARKLHVTIIAPVFERRAAGVYHNSAAVLDADGSLAGIYRKMHIPDDPCYYEKFYFTPGDLGFNFIQTMYGKIGVLICWDQWYPEAARLTSMLGASVLFYPTAIGWHPQEKKANGRAQRDAWQTIQRSHAIANGCYVAVANRIGHEKLAGDGIEFWGQSFVAGTSGEILAKAGAEREEVLVVPLDLDAVDTTRTHWPFLRDRRIDAYSGLAQRLLD